MLTTHLDRPTARAAVALANRAPSVHNSQPWRWRIGPSSVHLFADPDRALPLTDPEGRGLLVSCGAALHHLRVALLAAGLGGPVHRLPDPAHPRHLASIEPSPAEPTPDDLGLARAIETRRSDRRVFSTWPVPPEFLDDLVRAAAGEGAALVVLDPGRRWEAARLIERAAVEQALTPGLAQEVALWTGRARGAPDGVPAANVPGDGTAAVPVRHFAGREMDQSELGHEEADGTELAVLVTDGDTPEDRLRAGEALSAVLLRATATGLATDPISQPLEVEATRDRLAADCLPSGRHPQVLLRLGWAPVSATPVPATGRRPVDETIDPFDAPWA
ncbi:Acg family FMN-binding oxidoreductase [Trujillonella endophytica]|uniref:Nitroreductase family protein n=1 Tax=Trujillonella endophytica TaxID=673521 RepID=A0A1H8SX55_9ACTN|nr:nitroreductase family protein [Trujillella endophytica]SEO83340.1 Nitroreductase family protein [Trujillella endophytica]